MATTRGASAAARSTRSAIRLRRHGHGPIRLRLSRSMSMTTTGPDALARGKSWPMASKAASRALVIMLPGSPSHTAVVATTATIPHAHSRSKGKRIARAPFPRAASGDGVSQG